MENDTNSFDTNSFDQALQTWINAVQTQILYPQANEHWLKNHGQNYATLSTQNGQKFVRIVCTTLNSDTCWAFVAKNDGENRQLGKYRKGDIFKPAHRKAPAKHARGNIFENLPLSGITKWTGPNYL